MKDNLAFLEALQQIAKDKGISVDVLLDALANAARGRLQTDAGCSRGGGRHRRARFGRNPGLRPGARQ